MTSTTVRLRGGSGGSGCPIHEWQLDRLTPALIEQIRTGELVPEDDASATLLAEAGIAKPTGPTLTPPPRHEPRRGG